MKNTHDKEKSQKSGISPVKKDTQKSSENKTVEAAFAAALSQGAIPQTYSNELFAGLSKLGNSSFLKALERKESQNKAIKKYTEDEIFSREKVGLLLDRLSGDFHQPANEVELMPKMDNYQQLPALIGAESVTLSTLSPVPFEQGISQ